MSQGVVSYRNSTSNHNWKSSIVFSSLLYLIEILHQTTTKPLTSDVPGGCILSKFYIKPQLEVVHRFQFVVVSYRNSTSNHNMSGAAQGATGVVSYRNSTSNHNPPLHLSSDTDVVSYRNSTSNHNSAVHCSVLSSLYLIEILHQTTTDFDAVPSSCRCILSKFYIKPQLRHESAVFPIVVSYRNSTSNHNSSAHSVFHM